MTKILLTHKKERLLVYVLPKKQDTFEIVLSNAVKDCKTAHDEKGLTDHVAKCLQRNGFKILRLNDLEERKI